MSYMPCMIPRMIWEGTFFFPPWSKPNDLKVEQLDPETMSNNFRLWLTSMPAKSFPVQVGTKNNQGYRAIECTPSKPENDKGMNTGDRMFQTCLGSLNTRRTLYTSLQNVDSIHQKSAKQQHSCGQEVELQLICDIHPSEYCMTRCCRMVSRWQTNLLPDFEPTCAMPSVKRIPSDWSAFLGVQFIAS